MPPASNNSSRRGSVALSDSTTSDCVSNMKPKKRASFCGVSEVDEESPSKKKPVESGSMSNATWDALLRPQKYDNMLRILDSATSSNHGSCSWSDTYVSSSTGFSRFLPLYMHFDEHSKLRREFVTEMRLLSRLRHPCK